MKEKLAEIVKKHGKAMALELVAEAVIPALEAAAAKSATPIDDMILSALKEPLKKELLEMLDKV